MMVLGSVRAAFGVAAITALACAGHAAIVPVQQGLSHAHPAGPRIYNIAADGHGHAPSSYYQLIVDPWSEPTKFRTFATEPLGNTASFNLHADGDAPPGIGPAGPVPPQWSHKDVPARNLAPLHTHLLSAGQYVLEVATTPAAAPVSKQVSAVPLPGAMWLFGTALVAFIGIASRHKL
jgi:hypothetical protein